LSKSHEESMTADDPRVVRLAIAIVEFLDQLVINRPPRESGDRLIAIDAAALAVEGFEYRPIARLIAAGQLQTLRIGRRRYTRRSWLHAITNPDPAPKPEPRGLDAVIARGARPR
jgi:hypothetical protein